MKLDFDVIGLINIRFKCFLNINVVFLFLFLKALHVKSSNTKNNMNLNWTKQNLQHATETICIN